MRAFRADDARFLSLTAIARAHSTGLGLVAVVGAMGNATRTHNDDVSAITARP